MSASASVLGPPARPVLAWLADVPAVTRNTRARGRTPWGDGEHGGEGREEGGRGGGGEPFEHGLLPGARSGSATRRCNRPVCSPCKRNPRSAGTRQKTPLAACCHLAEAAVNGGQAREADSAPASSQNAAAEACAGLSRACGQ